MDPSEAAQLGAPDPDPDPDLELVPARMLNEFVYCPRLAFIEWVEGDFRDNFFTVDGRHAHRRVDRAGGTDVQEPATGSAGPDSPLEKLHARSVHLSAPSAGLIARIDLVEANGLVATPIDYKRGSPPDRPERCYEPEQVQLCAQSLILEENGFQCSRGILYFAGARQRVEVPITDELRARTLAAAGDLRAVARSGQLPPPLEGSPKCGGCSLAPVCLPDEIAFIARGREDREPRRLFAAQDDALPLHVRCQRGHVGRSGESLRIAPKEGEPIDIRLRDISQVAVYGQVQVSTQAIRVLCEHEIPLCFFSYGGWFYGMLQGLGQRNALLRRLQHAVSADPVRSLPIARSIVEQKIRNQRTLLRRNAAGVPAPSLQMLRHLALKARSAASVEELLGIEGSAARVYFSRFSQMLRPGGRELGFEMNGRNRRPPRDPVNCLLSLAYAVLVKDLTIVVTAVGFDPYCGFYHAPRYGRPSLPLDLMEPFRPLIGDSVVISAINNGVLQARDFVRRIGVVSLTDAGRQRFMQAYERRMDELITHPTFGYRLSYRRVLEVQARLVARMLAGEIKHYPAFVTR